MSANKTDFDQLVKDHLRMRLMESGWTNQMTKLVNESVAKRIESGQTSKSIKFNELYTDIIEKAHDTISGDMKLEFQKKVGEYLSLNLGNKASTCDASKVMSSDDDDSTDDAPKVIPSDDDDSTNDEICTTSS